jgi:hypothetical protein
MGCSSDGDPVLPTFPTPSRDFVYEKPIASCWGASPFGILDTKSDEGEDE